MSVSKKILSILAQDSGGTFVERLYALEQVGEFCPAGFPFENFPDSGILLRQFPDRFCQQSGDAGSMTTNVPLGFGHHLSRKREGQFRVHTYKMND